MTPSIGDVSSQSDAELLALSRSGDSAAWAELFRRHHDSGLRLAQSIANPSNADDIVSIAFIRIHSALRRGVGPDVALRPYLLQTVRNVAASEFRRDSRVVLVDELPETRPEAISLSPEDRRVESILLARAFRTLPLRWQAVLWHAVVEGEDLETVGRRLGLKANAVAALNFRARDGLRRAYVAEHTPDDAEPACRSARDAFPALLHGKISDRDRRPVDEHLDGCADCTQLLLELTSVTRHLGAMLAPAVLGAAAMKGHVPISGLPQRRSRRSSVRSVNSGVVSAAAATVSVAAVVAAAVGISMAASGGGRPSGGGAPVPISSERAQGGGPG